MNRIRRTLIALPLLASLFAPALAVTHAGAETTGGNRRAVSGTWALQQAGSSLDLSRQKPKIEAALSFQDVRGFSFRVPWKAIDTSLSLYDEGLAIAQAKGRAYSVRFMAGRSTPARVFDAGAYYYVLNGERIPKPFADDGTPGNPVFEAEYEKTVAAQAAWARANGVRLLHLPWYGRLWAEIDGATETVGSAVGYSSAAWLAGHKRLVDIAAKYVGDDLAVEFALSGYWGTNGRSAGELVKYMATKLGGDVAWSERFFVQSNVLGRYAANPVANRTIHHGLQMFDTGDYDWATIYAQLYTQKTTYVEVYVASFGLTNKANLQAEISRFAAHADASYL